jgi:hypothetical protein
MGRKSAAKKSPVPAPPAPPAPPGRSNGPWMMLGLAAVAVVAVAFIYMRPRAAEPTAAEAAAAAAPVAYPQPIKAHPQANLPQLQFPGYQTARPPETIRAAYQFAAEHPEVLSYVPCFCGCERSGHRGNEDCFVRERDVNGDVIAWDDHGMECAICLDVAERSRKLFAAGTSVADIRATIEREFGGHSGGHTPTPNPPASH